MFIYFSICVFVGSVKMDLVWIYFSLCERFLVMVYLLSRACRRIDHRQAKSELADESIELMETNSFLIYHVSDVRHFKFDVFSSVWLFSHY